MKQTQALEDLIVQTEIFLQYSLHSKAQERLQKIAAMFPGEEEKNTRLRNLYETANWWPQGAPKPKPAAPAAAAVVEAEVIPGRPSGEFMFCFAREIQIAVPSYGFANDGLTTNTRPTSSIFPSSPIRKTLSATTA